MCVNIIQKLAYCVCIAFLIVDSALFPFLSSHYPNEVTENYYDSLEIIYSPLLEIPVPESVNASSTYGVIAPEGTLTIYPSTLLYFGLYAYLIVITGLFAINYLSKHQPKLKSIFGYFLIFFILYQVATYFFIQFNQSMFSQETTDAPLPPTYFLYILYGIFSSFTQLIVNIVAGLLAVFYIIKKYKIFREYVYEKPIGKLNLLVERDNSAKKTDLAHFVALSVIVIFLAKVMFIATSSQNILGFIPGVSG